MMNPALHIADKHRSASGNRQPPPPAAANVPARLLGWGEDGAARVELLSAVGGIALGSPVSASVRETVEWRKVPDFTVLKKAGLRTGGVVLLRKALPSPADPEAVTAREIETLVARRDDGLAVVIRGAAASICPPPPGTLIVSHCLVADLASAVRFKEMEPSLARVSEAVEDAVQFGPAGLVLTGEDRDGELVEVTVGGEEHLSTEDLLRSFRASCPPDLLEEAASAKDPWMLVPFFRCPVDRERAGKVSAQRANFDYGEGLEPKWTACDAVLRTVFGGWAVADVSASMEPAPPTSLLLDLAARA